MSATYRVVIRGVSPGKSIAEVAVALSPVFKVSPEKLVALLQSPEFVVKRGIALEEAARYKAALRSKGAVILVEPETISQGVNTGDFASHLQPKAEPPGKTSVVAARQNARDSRFAVVLLGTLVIGGICAILYNAPEINNFINTRASSKDGRPLQIVGAWSCRDTNPNGTVTENNLRFASDGTFGSSGSGFFFTGTYQGDSGQLTLHVTRAGNAAVAMDANQFVDITLKSLGNNSLTFNSVSRRSGSKRASDCTREN